MQSKLVSFLELILPDGKQNTHRKDIFVYAEQQTFSVEQSDCIASRSQAKPVSNMTLRGSEWVSELNPRSTIQKGWTLTGNKNQGNNHGRTQDKRSETSDGRTHSLNELDLVKLSKLSYRKTRSKNR